MMLRLSVREITSVSATFVLSSRLHSDADPSLSSLGLTDPDNAAESSLIADALARGLSVTVNGSAWPRTFIRIDEQTDEAVIIIYALMPGRQYDIELGLASEQAIGDSLRRQIVTHENETNQVHNDPDSQDESSSSSSSSSSVSSPSSSTPPTSSPFTPPPSHPSPTTPPPQPTLTLTERLTQLHQSLSHLTTERDTLLTSLKSLRRESQKADASLRAEIDTLKRTFDKNASFELRSRQKLLALQESVKRAQNAARESQEMTREVEREILELVNKKEEKENEHRRMEDEAGRVRRERGEVEEKERKRGEGMRGELNGLTNKLERLNGRRERMEAMVIPDLEAKVQDIEGEIEDAEREVAQLEQEEQTRLQFEETYLSYHQQHLGGPLWAPPASPSAARPTRTHNPRSHSMHSTTAAYPPPPPRQRPSLKTSTKSTSMSMMNTSASQLASSSSSLFPTDQPPQHASPISPSSRSSPGTSGGIINLKGSAGTAYSPCTVSPSDVLDPLAVGAGRPSRRSLERPTNRLTLG